MKKIKIGADELILWLRKNAIAEDIPNDETNGLGWKIRKLIESLGGKKTADSVPSYWSMENEVVGKLKLPKNAAQYEIDSIQLGKLYEELSNW